MRTELSVTPSTAARATWYSWLLTGFYLYSVNLQGNVVPFLQAEFALSYRAVSLHSSAIAVGIILVGLRSRCAGRIFCAEPASTSAENALGDRVAARLARRRTLWLGIGGLPAAPCSASRRRRGPASRPAS
jgi:hypothetical protein